jgi:hypothetical protein
VSSFSFTHLVLFRVGRPQKPALFINKALAPFRGATSIGTALKSLTIERIHKGHSSHKIKSLLLGDLSIEKGKLLSETPVEDLAKLITRFVTRTVLSSPRVLFFTEKLGRLDDYSIASRLSYFLRSRPPDQALLTAAKKRQPFRPKSPPPTHRTSPEKFTLRYLRSEFLR